jgi:hypothetical protein
MTRQVPRNQRILSRQRNLHRRKYQKDNMEFIAGIIVGILLCLVMAAIVILLRKPLEQKLSTAVKQIENAGPRPKGFIYMPPDEDEEARAAKIAENQKNGRDTKLSDL